MTITAVVKNGAIINLENAPDEVMTNPEVITILEKKDYWSGELSKLESILAKMKLLDKYQITLRF